MKKENYSYFDYICIFEMSPNFDLEDQFIVVKIRRYQSSLSFKRNKPAEIVVLKHNKIVLKLYDDGNGIDVDISSRLDYSQLDYLTCALKAYDSDNKFSRVMRKVEI